MAFYCLRRTSDTFVFVYFCFVSCSSSLLPALIFAILFSPFTLPNSNSDSGPFTSRALLPPSPLGYAPSVFIARIIQRFFPRRFAPDCAYPPYKADPIPAARAASCCRCCRKSPSAFDNISPHVPEGSVGLTLTEDEKSHVGCFSDCC